MSDPILPYRDLFKHLHEDTKQLRENLGMIHAHFQEISTLMADLHLHVYVYTDAFLSIQESSYRLSFECFNEDGGRVENQGRIMVLRYCIGEEVWDQIMEVKTLPFDLLVLAYRSLPDLVRIFIERVNQKNQRATELEALTNEFRDSFSKLMKK